MAANYALAELRVLVGYLGERGGWWNSQFYSATAGAFLKPVFGRSLPLAQYQGVTAAAARVHDQYIGVGQIFHLFRMPELSEQGAASIVATAEHARAIAENVTSNEQALSRLTAISQEVESVEGPVGIGAMSEGGELVLRRMAGHYLTAFQDGFKTFPYVRES